MIYESSKTNRSTNLVFWCRKDPNAREFPN